MGLNPVDPAPSGPPPSPRARPTRGAAARVWWRIGCLGFGGPAGQIALLHREVVELRRWIDDAGFQRALGFCTLLPGPEAQQLATYLGWRLHGAWGGVVAGTLFWIPGAVLIWALAWLYVTWGPWPAVKSLSGGLSAVALALVISATIRMAQRGLKHSGAWWVAAGAFVALLLEVWFPAILATAALIGAWGGWGEGQADLGVNPDGDSMATTDPAPSGIKTVLVALRWVVIWWAPLLALGVVLGWHHRVFELAGYFSQAAMLTFGGAYAVLPYVAHHAAAAAWVTPGEFADGLALGETTPGPLVLVLQWVGFLAAWKQPGRLAPWAGGTLGAMATSWATFAPSFLWIFVFAPWIEHGRHLRGKLWPGALAGIQAAVVGFIASLAGRLGQHVVWPAGAGSPIQFWAVALAVVATGALVSRKIPVWLIVVFGAAAGVVRGLG